MVLLGFLGAVALIARSYVAWQQTPVSTTTKTVPIDHLDFPTVTVCPPKGSHTALNYDLMKADNSSLTEEDRESLKEAVYKIIIKPTHQDFIELMMATVEKENLREMFEGHHSVPGGYQEAGQEVYVSMRETTGRVQSPGYGEERKDNSCEEDRHHHLILRLPHNVQELVGNGSLVFQLEVSTRDEEDLQEYVAYREGYKHTFHNHTKMMWDDAEKYCQKEGGHLTSVLTEEEDEKVANLTNGINAWIGGSDKELDWSWNWTDSSSWDYTNWAEGKPNGKSEQGCVEINNGQLNDQFCKEFRSFICKSNPKKIRGKSLNPLTYLRHQLNFGFIEILHRARCSQRKPVASSKDTQRTGFRLTWFLKDVNGHHVTEGKQFENIEPKNQNSLFLKMVEIAAQARKENVTQDEIVSQTIQKKAKLIENGTLNKTICQGGQVKNESRSWLFNEIMVDSENQTESNTQVTPTDEDIETGFMVFSAVVYCSESVALAQFLHNLLSTKSPRTIIQATVNTIQSDHIMEYRNRRFVNSFYLALDNVFKFKLGQILLATASPSELQGMVDKEWPYFAKFSKELEMCLDGSNCQGVREQIKSLGNEQILLIFS